MVTIRRRRLGVVWVVAVLLAGLLGVGGRAAVVDTSDRALAAVASITTPVARADVVLPRAETRTLAPGKPSHGHLDSPAVTTALVALVLPVLFHWRRRVASPGRPDRHAGARTARGPPPKDVRASDRTSGGVQKAPSAHTALR